MKDIGRLGVWMFPDALTARARDGAGAFLDQSVIFGALGKDERLRNAVASAEEDLKRDGLAAVLQRYARGPLPESRPRCHAASGEDVTG